MRRHGTARTARGTQRQRVGQERAERLLAQERDLTKRWEKPLIGNRVSQIYHTPDHKNYGDVHPKNQVHFWTEQEAEDAGYRRAANDHYGRGSGTAMTVEARQRREKEVTGNRHETARDTRSVERQLRDLAARLEGEDTPQGGGVRVRLYEQEREQGMGW